VDHIHRIFPINEGERAQQKVEQEEQKDNDEDEEVNDCRKGW